MKALRKSLALLIILVLMNSCQHQSPLFQEGADDWMIEGDAHWSFKNAELIGEVENGAGFVISKQTYQNFILTLDFKPDSSINLGVFIRCKSTELTASNCYELNIWDLHPNQDNRTGAIVTKAVPLAHLETINKWNTYKIKCDQDHLQVWINNVLTADYIDQTFIEGYIGLQAAETGKIKFRNILIKSLD